MKLDFIPERDGFHFPNRFVHQSFPLIPGMLSHGRCGGMACASLDYWRHGLAVPTHVPDDFNPREVPDGRLGQYILDRLLNTLWNAAILQQVWGDRTRWETATRLSIDENFPIIRAKLDQLQQPVVVGLWGLRWGDVVGHQVLAYGYEESPPTLYVYDSNHPDVELRLRHALRERTEPERQEEVVTLIDPADRTRDDYRGYYWLDVYDYVGAPPPPYHDLALTYFEIEPGLEGAVGGPLGVTATVTNEGDYTAHFEHLFVYVRDPSGANRDDILGGAEPGAEPLAPGQSRTIQRSVQNFGDVEGTWTVGVSYLSARHHWRPLRPHNKAGTERTIHLTVREPAPVRWGELGAGLASDPVVGVNRDGRMEVFAIRDGRLWHISQTQPSNGWGGWEPVPAGNSLPAHVVLVDTPSVVRNAQHHLEVFVRGSNDEIWHLHQTPNERNGWSDWENRGGPVTSAVAVMPNFDFRLQMFGRFRDNGAMRHAYQRVQGGLWSGWERDYQRPITRPPVVGQHTYGRLEVFVVLEDRRIYHTWQDNPGGQFSDLARFGDDEVIAEPAVASFGGRIHVFAPRVNGGVVGRWEEAPEGAWSPWTLLPIRMDVLDGTRLDATFDRRGALALAATAPDRSVVVATSVGQGWERTELGGSASGRPVLSQNVDGRLEVFVRGMNGTVQHRWEPWS